MLRTVRAFGWMRWRVTMNAFRIRQRDSLEQVSRALGTLAPFFLALLLVPTVLVLAAGATWVGYRMGAARTVMIHGSWIYLALRVGLAMITLVVLIAPMVRSARGTGAETTRLLLLPIRRAVLHAAEVVGALSDPWLAVMVPALILFPVGLIAGGSVAAGAVSLVGALLFVAILMLLVSLMSFAIGLVFRRRNRAEWVMVVLITVLSMSGLFFGGFGQNVEDDLRRKKNEVKATLEKTPDEERGMLVSQYLDRRIPAAAGLLPSEMVMRLVAAGIDGRRSAAGAQLLMLAVWAGVLYAGSRWTHTRLLETPETGGSGRTGGGLRMRSIPGAGPGASAVAMATVRLALRTVRGKTAVYLNMPVTVMIYVLLLRSGENLELPGGLGFGVLIGLAGSLFTLISLQPILANAFAVDAEGLTLQFLGPLGTRSLLRGKFVGGAILTAISVGLCFLAGLVLDPSGSPLLWLAALATAVSLYLCFGPLGLLLSALFPKVADLSRIGKEGNAQPVAALIAFFAVILALVPPGLLLASTLLLAESTLLTAAAALLWLGFSAVLCTLSLRALEEPFERRRENLLLVATGR